MTIVMLCNEFLEYKRVLRISIIPNPTKGSGAAFLWGPRQTGKTTLLRQQFPKARYYDLLDTALCAELTVRPSIFRQQILAELPHTVVIDEVQKVPDLIGEVHWLLENTSTQFVLCGSSARKLKRKAKNLLGGRAVEYHLFPLTSHEIPDLDLNRMLNHGSLPTHYLLDTPRPLLKAYLNTYIKEEIVDESVTRNIPAFSRFLEIVGLTHGQQLNYANIARESGVSASTVRNYYQILKDTLLGFELPPWRRSRKRRLVETAKFYLFDIGVANVLHPELRQVTEGTDLFGRAFEHFLLNEVRAYCAYNQRDVPLSYWRTSSGFEVNLILGNMQAAIEFKASRDVRGSDLKGLRALKDEHTPQRAIVVNRSTQKRTTEDGIEIIHWTHFCSDLWRGRIL